jgi:hypothetical protein
MIFDDWKSCFHLLIGSIAGFSLQLSLPFTILLSIIFGLYQVLESDTLAELLSDLTEFGIGFIAGCVLSYSCRFILNLAF